MEYTHVAAVVFLLSVGIHAADWSYLRGQDDGPRKWFSASPICLGKKNSPIDINTHAANSKPAEKWNLVGWDKEATWTVTDKAYTVQYDLEKLGTITTSGGSLDGTYTLAQFHFHWGAVDSKGSEHLIDHRSYPLEVHFVHKNPRYSTFQEALSSNNSKALAVLGFMFEIQEEDNSDFEPIVEGDLAASQHPNHTVSGFSIGKLSSLLQESLDGDFYRYEGGLTTPGCHEVVTWTVFAKSIKISRSQMESFRLIAAGEFGPERYRPVVPLGDRTVTHYEVEKTPAGYDDDDDNEGSKQAQPMFIIIVAGGSASVAAIMGLIMAYLYNRK